MCSHNVVVGPLKSLTNLPCSRINCATSGHSFDSSACDRPRTERKENARRFLFRILKVRKCYGPLMRREGGRASSSLTADEISAAIAANDSFVDALERIRDQRS